MAGKVYGALALFLGAAAHHQMRDEIDTTRGSENPCATLWGCAFFPVDLLSGLVMVMDPGWIFFDNYKPTGPRAWERETESPTPPPPSPGKCG